MKARIVNVSRTQKLRQEYLDAQASYREEMEAWQRRRASVDERHDEAVKEWQAAQERGEDVGPRPVIDQTTEDEPAYPQVEANEDILQVTFRTEDDHQYVCTTKLDPSPEELADAMRAAVEADVAVVENVAQGDEIEL